MGLCFARAAFSTFFLALFLLKEFSDAVASFFIKCNYPASGMRNQTHLDVINTGAIIDQMF